MPRRTTKSEARRRRERMTADEALALVETPREQLRERVVKAEKAGVQMRSAAIGVGIGVVGTLVLKRLLGGSA